MKAAAPAGSDSAQVETTLRKASARAFPSSESANATPSAGEFIARHAAVALVIFVRAFASSTDGSSASASSGFQLSIAFARLVSAAVRFASSGMLLAHAR